MLLLEGREAQGRKRRIRYWGVTRSPRLHQSIELGCVSKSVIVAILVDI